MRSRSIHHHLLPHSMWDLSFSCYLSFLNRIVRSRVLVLLCWAQIEMVLWVVAVFGYRQIPIERKAVVFLDLGWLGIWICSKGGNFTVTLVSLCSVSLRAARKYVMWIGDWRNKREENLFLFWNFLIRVEFFFWYTSIFSFSLFVSALTMTLILKLANNCQSFDHVCDGHENGDFLWEFDNANYIDNVCSSPYYYFL